MAELIAQSARHLVTRLVERRWTIIYSLPFETDLGMMDGFVHFPIVMWPILTRMIE